jgi:hypothetical protein
LAQQIGFPGRMILMRNLDIIPSITRNGKTPRSFRASKNLTIKGNTALLD